MTRGIILPPTERVPETVASPTTPKLPEMVAEAREMLSFKETVAEDPREISPPPVKLVPAVTVTLELDKAELGILVKVLEEPERVLFVRVWVLSSKTILPSVKVSAAKVGEEALDKG